MDHLLLPQRLAILWERLYDWLVTSVLVAENAAQAAVVLAALGLAALAARRWRSRLETLHSHPTFGRSTALLTDLLMPILWFVLLWLGISGAVALNRPGALLSTTATLLAAWIAIHLASQVVRNPVWAKLFARVAWSIAALSILGLLDPTISVLDSAAIQIGQVRISLYTVVSSTLALAVLLSVALYAAGLIEARVRTSGALSPTVQVLFAKSLKMVLIAFAILVAIRAVGIDLTALAVVGGAIGLGVGFGFQKTVSNLISGVILLIDKSIKPGDIIGVSGTYGWVTTMGGRYVSIVTRDGVEHLVPNETLISERVENWTHTNRRTRLRVDVGVHYDSDLPQVIALCEAAARDTERVLGDPEPKCLFLEFGDSALKLQVRFWVADAQNGVQNVKSAVLLKIWEAFKTHGVNVPYPQREVHVRSGTLPPPRSEST